MADEKETAPAQDISREQMKFLVKSLWKSLLAPSWTKDGLITLGKLIFAKTELKEMSDKTYMEIWPHLKSMATTLDAVMTEEAVRLTTVVVENAERQQEAATATQVEAPVEKKTEASDK